jgi:autotransporter-associated beta strand protein
MVRQFVSTARSQDRQPGSSLGIAAVSKIVVKLLPRLCAVSVIVLAALMAPVAHAVDVVLTATNAINTSSWNSTLSWSPAIAPSAGNNYFTNGFTIRTPNATGNQSFAGDSLTMNGGGILFAPPSGSATITVGNLILAGGTVANARDNTTMTLSGNVTLAANTTTSFNPAGTTRFINVTVPISGSGNLTFRGIGATILSAANTFTGSSRLITDASTTLRLANFQALQNSALEIETIGNVSLAAGTGTYVFGGLTGSVNLSTRVTGNATHMTTLRLNPLSGTVT